MATSISENASETMKKFCTVRNGRNVKTDKITSIFPQIHKTTILERTSATGNALTRGIGFTELDNDEAETVVEFIDDTILTTGGDKRAIVESLDDIKYQSIFVKFNGKRILL